MLAGQHRQADRPRGATRRPGGVAAGRVPVINPACARYLDEVCKI